MNFLTYLESIISVSSELKDRIENLTTIKSLSKGELLMSQGKRCTEIFFIQKGLLRGYYFDHGKEITHWFAREGEFATCFYSFISHEVSQEFIEAIEDCEVRSISYNFLQTLYKDFPETERLGRLLTEQYYLRLEGRLLALHFKSAKQRYEHLLSFNKELLQRVSLGQIASYLGITQETLSRIRGEL